MASSLFLDVFVGWLARVFSSGRGGPKGTAGAQGSVRVQHWVPSWRPHVVTVLARAPRSLECMAKTGHGKLAELRLPGGLLTNLRC